VAVGSDTMGVVGSGLGFDNRQCQVVEGMIWYEMDNAC
jgi:hypothetical protein